MFGEALKKKHNKMPIFHFTVESKYHTRELTIIFIVLQEFLDRFTKSKKLIQFISIFVANINIEFIRLTFYSFLSTVFDDLRRRFFCDPHPVLKNPTAVKVNKLSSSCI